MTYVLYAVAALAALFIAFVFWRYTSVARGARQRDERIVRLVHPLIEAFEAGTPASADDVAALAARPESRLLLYGTLKHFDRLDLFPERYLTPAAQGEAQLVYWMMHPNELQDAPAQIELVEAIPRTLRNREAGTFFVYRYQMPAGHWAGDAWFLGLAGPYVDGDPPYENSAGAFSRCADTMENTKPTDLVDWYVGMAARKGAVWAPS